MVVLGVNEEVAVDLTDVLRDFASCHAAAAYFCVSVNYLVDYTPVVICVYFDLDMTVAVAFSSLDPSDLHSRQYLLGEFSSFYCYFRVSCEVELVDHFRYCDDLYFVEDVVAVAVVVVVAHSNHRWNVVDLC